MPLPDAFGADQDRSGIFIGFPGGQPHVDRNSLVHQCITGLVWCSQDDDMNFLALWGDLQRNVALANDQRLIMCFCPAVAHRLRVIKPRSCVCVCVRMGGYVATWLRAGGDASSATARGIPAT